MKTDQSQDFQTFHQYVFGDYRYYYYNGLSEDIFTRLEGSERKRAEELILEAIKKKGNDERQIRAAGYLMLKAALPLFEKRLAAKLLKPRRDTRSSIIWAIYKINADKKKLDIIIDVVNNVSNPIGLNRWDAVNLLSDYGKDPSAIEALFKAYLDKDYRVNLFALNSLNKIFKDDVEILNLLKSTSFSSLAYERGSIINQLKTLLGN
jgi:hypothetical protein